MAVPYSAIPIEAHMAMISAEQASVPVLADAARMWTEVRAWIEAARVELRNRMQNLSPHWQDDAGRAMEEKVQRTDAELAMWAQRIDGAHVVETLTTLSAAIPPTFQAVSTLYEGYLAALANPLTAPSAPAFQQAAGAQMTALGAQFDMSMLKVCAAAGIASPGDVLPKAEAPAKGNSPQDVMSAAEATMGALTELEGLASDVVDLGASSGGAGGSGGPSLAGLAPSVPGAGAIPGVPAGAVPGSGAPPASGPPVPTGWLGTPGVAGGSAVPIAKTVAGKRTPGVAPEIRPGAPEAAGPKPAGAGMAPPPMPLGAGHGAPGTLRPGSSEHPTGRSPGGPRVADGTEGVPEALRGKSGSGAAFGFAPGRHSHDPGLTPVQPLDEEMWRVYVASLQANGATT